MRLAQKIEERALAPFRRGEALVGGIVGNQRRFGLAGEPTQRIREQAKEARRERRLRLDGAGGIGEPMFADLAHRADGGLQLVGHVGRLLAVLRRLQRGRQRPAALLDEPRHIIGDALEIGLWPVGVRGQFGEAGGERGEGRMQRRKAGRKGRRGRLGRSRGRFGRRRNRFGCRGLARGSSRLAQLLVDRGLRPDAFLFDLDGCLHLAQLFAARRFACTHGFCPPRLQIFLHYAGYL